MKNLEQLKIKVNGDEMKLLNTYENKKQYFIMEIESKIIKAIKSNDKSLDLSYMDIYSIFNNLAIETFEKDTLVTIFNLILDEVKKDYKVIQIYKDYSCIMLNNSKISYLEEYINHFARVNNKSYLLCIESVLILLSFLVGLIVINLNIQGELKNLLLVGTLCFIILNAFLVMIRKIFSI